MNRTCTKIQIYDTTLRDGAQGEGISFSVQDKLRIAQKLDKLGVAYIEGGWPGSNPRDAEFFAAASRLDWQFAKLTAFGSTRRAGLAAEQDENLQKGQGLLKLLPDGLWGQNGLIKIKRFCLWCQGLL